MTILGLAELCAQSLFQSFHFKSSFLGVGLAGQGPPPVHTGGERPSSSAKNGSGSKHLVVSVDANGKVTTEWKS